MSKVVVLGSAGFDLTVRLDRLPRPGETRLGGALITGPGGKGANAAMAARKAGADVIFLTAFGDDEFGRKAAENAWSEGIDLSYAKVVGGEANQVALIFVDDEGQNLIGVAPGASEHLRPEDVDALPDSIFEQGGILLACLEIPIETVMAGLKRARRAGMTTILNPAPASNALVASGILDLVSILTPNQEEALALTGQSAASLDGARQAAELLQGPEAVIITMGAGGALVVVGARAELVPTPVVPVVDTVGAGDAFNGALAVGLSEGWPLIDAVAFACAAGSLAVTRCGAQGALPSRSEIEKLRSRYPGSLDGFH